MKAILFLLLTWPCISICQSVSETYGSGDIPTSLGNFNPSCNGPLTTLAITLPVGNPIEVTGIDIAYDMTAQGGGLKEHQRSRIFCQNTNTPEPAIYSGTGNISGVQSYSRDGVNIANGIYPAGSEIVFEMRAWRTSEGIGCNTTYNRVDNFSWTITLYYQTVPDDAGVGIGTTTPDASALLDLNSFQRGLLPPRMSEGFRDAIETPALGLTIFNTTDSTYNYWNGDNWVEIGYVGGISSIEDADNDTKIQVEESADDDTIRFDIAGIERWTMEGVRLVSKNTGSSIFIGEDAGLNDDLTENASIAIGWNALLNNDDGSNNVAIGYKSLYTTGYSNNTAIGNYSMAAASAGCCSTGIGYRSLFYNAGNINTAIGAYALDSVWSSGNTAVGYYSLARNNDFGTSPNTAIGAYSLTNTKGGEGNTAIGYESMENNITGLSNAAVGHRSLVYNSAGDYNVAVGYYSGEGDSGVDFSSCTFIGAFSSPTVSRTNVSMLGYGISNAECTGSYQVLLGNTAIGSIRAAVTGITAYSDARYKTNITEDIKGLDFIRRLRPVSYNVRPKELHKIWGTPDSLYLLNDYTDVEQMRFSGFLAQEVEQAAAASNYSFTGIDVPRNERETYALRYTEFIVPLVKAVQELQVQVEELKSEIEILKNDRKP